MVTRIVGVVVVLMSLVGVAACGFFGGRAAVAQPGVPAPEIVTVQTTPRPITEVACGQTYQLDHLERFRLEGRTVVNFYFGGKDRSMLAQYVVDRNVIGLSTEIVEDRRVNRHLEYSKVTFLCMSDTMLEGHRASNIEVMRYRLTLRRPLRPQTAIRNGGPDRK